MASSVCFPAHFSTSFFIYPFIHSAEASRRPIWHRGSSVRRRRGWRRSLPAPRFIHNNSNRVIIRSEQNTSLNPASSSSPRRCCLHTSRQETNPPTHPSILVALIATYSISIWENRIYSSLALSEMTPATCFVCHISWVYFHLPIRESA